MSLRTLAWAWEQYQLRPALRVTLMVLSQHVSALDHQSSVSLGVLAAETGLSEPGVRHALAELCKALPRLQYAEQPDGPAGPVPHILYQLPNS